VAAAQIPISRGTPIVPESEGADTSRLLRSIAAPSCLAAIRARSPRRGSRRATKRPPRGLHRL